jgi:hypothetical protein
MTWSQAIQGDEGAPQYRGRGSSPKYSIFHHASEIHLGEEASLQNCQDNKKKIDGRILSLRERRNIAWNARPILWWLSRLERLAKSVIDSTGRWLGACLPYQDE